ncbi:DUF4258 domain-containing protein [Shewanella algae]|uniref:DUF4258 domain-containing protein n=1 Tax=Shewanella algae TaxID=38313 RepID=UPI00118244AA|nr:DUF4258 domain-containing protein [Shewanella algae]TVL14775.1 hypothetical protein AYJ02_11975 [Shewanella algae]
MKLLISKAIQKKLLEKHNVSPKEVFECFFNRTHSFLIDKREEHKTDPITKWFVSETDVGRKLKVCFIETKDGIAIKTTFEPKPGVISLYFKVAKEEIEQ